MAFKVTIGGVNVTSSVYLGTGYNPSVTRKLNERSSAMLTLVPGSSVPTRFTAISIYETDGSTLRFAGVIDDVATRSIESGGVGFESGGVGSAACFYDLTCIGNEIYADWCYWAKTYSSAKTVKEILADIITDKLGDYGATMDAAQDDGDTFDPAPVIPDPGQQVSAFIRTLLTWCDPPRVLVVSPANEWRIMVPGSTSAPYAISDAHPNCSDFEWAYTTFTPANKVTLSCGPSSQATPTQTWTADGIATSWEVDVQAVLGGWTQGYVSEDGTTIRTVSGAGEGGYYYWDDTGGTDGRGQISVGTGSTPGAGVVLGFVYTAQYPFSVSQASGATPVIEQQYSDATQLSRASGLLEAAGLLAQLNQTPRQAAISVWTTGWDIGQAISATLTVRGFAGATLTASQTVSEFTEAENSSGVRLWHTVIDADDTTVYQGSYLSQARSIFGGASASSVTATGGGGGGGASVPLPFGMGGSDQASLPSGTATAYTELLNRNVFTPQATFTARIRGSAWTRAAAQVKLELYNLTDSAQVNETSWLTATARPALDNVNMIGPVVAGKSYVLRVKSDTADVAPYGIGQLETA